MKCKRKLCPMYCEKDGYIDCDCAYQNGIHTFSPVKDCIVDDLILKKQEEIETLKKLQKILIETE